MEDALDMFFVLTSMSLGVLPGIPAYVLCRHASIWWRLVPATCVVAAGLWAVRHTAHGLAQFCMACLVYAGLCVWGLQKRPQEKKDRWIPNLDWIAVSAFVGGYWLIGAAMQFWIRMTSS